MRSRKQCNGSKTSLARVDANGSEACCPVDSEQLFNRQVAWILSDSSRPAVGSQAAPTLLISICEPGRRIWIFPRRGDDHVVSYYPAGLGFAPVGACDISWDMRPDRVEILGVPVDCVDMGQALNVVDEILRGNRQEYVLAVNSEKVLRARDHSVLLHCLRNAGLLIPDGIGAVLAVRLLHGLALQRVPGADLMPLICECARQQEAGVFLFGAKPDVNQETKNYLTKRFPGLKIVGNRDGYVSETEMPGLIEEINDCAADVLFIALGSPRQELWIDRHKGNLKVKLVQGVGGSFDVISGYVKRAPAFFRNAHLEWLYRVVAQPSKLPRGLINIKFGLMVLLAKLGWG